MKTILVFGDSISFGDYDIKKGGWADRLKVYLLEKEKNVYNLGIPGDNSQWLKERFKEESKSRIWQDTLAIVSIGINDTLKNVEESVSLEDFKKNLRKIISDSKKLNLNLVFLGITNVNELKTNPTSYDEMFFYNNKEIKKYNLAIKEISKKESLSFISISNILNNEDFEDGIPPNSKGHEKIFNEVKSFLEKENLI